MVKINDCIGYFGWLFGGWWGGDGGIRLRWFLVWFWFILKDSY